MNQRVRIHKRFYRLARICLKKPYENRIEAMQLERAIKDRLKSALKYG